MTKYNRTISELESKAILWWPERLTIENALISVIPKLIETQDEFLGVISSSNENPYHVFEKINESNLSANLFLKHLCVLADYGGEPIQRLGRAFSAIFKNNNKHSISFAWKTNNYTYEFLALPVSGLGNKKLFIDKYNKGPVMYRLFIKIND